MLFLNAELLSLYRVPPLWAVAVLLACTLIGNALHCAVSVLSQLVAAAAQLVAAQLVAAQLVAAAAQKPAAATPRVRSPAGLPAALTPPNLLELATAAMAARRALLGVW